MAWKKLSSTSVYKNKWMEVTEDQVETDLGKSLTFGVVHKEPFALIIPWDGTHFYLVGQYRYPVDEFSWEFPQGHFEHDSILETARHELQEETGLRAATIEEIAVTNLAPGHHSQKCHIFLATNVTPGASHQEESEEGMKVRTVTLEEFRKMIVSNEINDSPTLAAFAVMTAMGQFPKQQ